MAEEFEVGEQIVWWSDGHNGAGAPDDPDAKQRTGTVSSVHRHPEDENQIVAYLVKCRGGISGTYITTVRPELHHPAAADHPAT